MTPPSHTIAPCRRPARENGVRRSDLWAARLLVAIGRRSPLSRVDGNRRTGCFTQKSGTARSRSSATTRPEHIGRGSVFAPGVRYGPTRIRARHRYSVAPQHRNRVTSRRRSWQRQDMSTLLRGEDDRQRRCVSPKVLDTARSYPNGVCAHCCVSMLPDSTCCRHHGT